MLSENLQKIAAMIGEMARVDIDENDADANMAYAWGTASGIILREVNVLKDQGR